MIVRHVFAYICVYVRSYMCMHEGKQLLMVLDGHDGTRAVKFAYTNLPHLLLSCDMDGGEDRTMQIMRNAILATERNFFVGIDHYITRKVTLQIEIEVKMLVKTTEVMSRIMLIGCATIFS